MCSNCFHTVTYLERINKKKESQTKKESQLKPLIYSNKQFYRQQICTRVQENEKDNRTTNKDTITAGVTENKYKYGY